MKFHRNTDPLWLYYWAMLYAYFGGIEGKEWYHDRQGMPDQLYAYTLGYEVL